MDFLNDKISRQYKYEVSNPDFVPNNSRGRFISAKIDFKDFKKNLITGRGLIKQTRFKINDENLFINHRTNGLSDLAVRFGVIGFILYFYLLFISFKQFCIINRFNPNFSYFIVAIIMATAFGQPLLLSHVFFSLIFLHVLYTKKTIKKSN